MVRQLLFVVISGFILVFGGLGALEAGAQSTPTTNGTESVLAVADSVSAGLGGVLLGAMALVLISAVTLLR